MATFASIYDGPPRHYGSTSTDKRYIAIHNTSNDATAEGEASYAKRREDSVSSHYYVDNNSIVQSLNTDLRAYHAGSTIGNSQAIAYEITGTNAKSRAWWLANVAWPLLARQIALDCREHAIEPRLLTVTEIKAGKLTGIITHDLMRQAWGGTTHTDPGANFPLDYLLALVRAELEEDDMFEAADRQLLRNINTALLFGGPSCGPAVDAENAQNTTADEPYGKVARDYRNSVVSQLAQIRDGQKPGASDVAAIKAVMLDPEVLAALATAVNDDAAARLAE